MKKFHRFKRKYEEEQKRIEISLRLDLEKVKEEENQRREQVNWKHIILIFYFELKKTK